MLNFKNTVICIAALFLLGCETEEFPNLSEDYPVLVTQEVEEIDEEGVLLSATLVVPESEEVTSFGFEIFDRIRPFRIDLTSWKSLDDFSYKLTSNQENGQEISYRAYATTSSYELVGTTKSFVSKGSSFPELIDFYPRTPTIQSEITVVGRNFNVGQLVLVPFFEGTERAQISVKSLTKGDVDTIRFNLNPSLLDDPTTAIVIRSGEDEVPLSGSFAIQRPGLTFMESNEGFFNETEFTVRLENFDPTNSDSNQSHKFQLRSRVTGRPDTFSEPIITDATENTISFINPVETINSNPLLQLVISGIRTNEATVDAEQTLRLTNRWQGISTIFSSTVNPIFAGIIGDRAYVLTGQSLKVHDIPNRSRSSMSIPNFNNASRLQTFTIGNLLYIGTGPDTNLFYSFNTTTRDWTRLNDFTFPDSQGSIHGVFDNKYHVITSNSVNGTIENQHIIYDPALDLWTIFAFNTESSIPAIKGTEPFYTNDGQLNYLVTDTDEMEAKIYSIDLTSATPQIRLKSSFFDPQLSPLSPGMVAITSEDHIIFAGGGSNEQYYLYNFTEDRWIKTSPATTKNILYGFFYEGETYAVLPQLTAPGRSSLVLFNPSLL